MSGAQQAVCLINSFLCILIRLTLLEQFQYFLKDPVKYDVKYQVRSIWLSHSLLAPALPVVHPWATITSFRRLSRQCYFDECRQARSRSSYWACWWRPWQPATDESIQPVDLFRCDEIRFQRPCRSHCVSSLWAGWGREKRKINFVKFRWCSSHLVIEGKISDILCCCSRFSRYTLTETLKTIVQLSAAQPPAVLQCFQWTVLRWNPA